MSAHPLAPAWLQEPLDANALEPGLWPATAARTAGALEIGGVSAADLAARFGTPLYVLDEQDVRARAARVRGAFEGAAARHGAGARVYYAGKALLTTDIVRWMLEAGLRIDACSGGELAIALAAGAPPERLGLHGNNKSLGEIERAVGVGVGAIVLYSVLEVDRVADAARRHGRVQAVRLRISSGVHASTHEYLATAREDQKFGIALADAARVVARIRAQDSLAFLGVHSHIGSQIFDAAGFEEAARRLLELHAGLLADGPVPELNLGGGFGIAYTSVDRPAPIEQIADSLADAVAVECRRRGIPVPDLAVEPGRILVGPAGVTLYEIGTVKDVEVAHAAGRAARRYVSVDGGMSDNIRPALYGADYSSRLAGRVSDAAPALVRIAGKHCESGDIVVRDDYLPGDVAPGDLVAVAATGAYCFSLASNYNALGRPPLVAVRDGAARMLVRGETIDDLLARDMGAGSSGGTA
ncbi:MAG: diaminopimelate decarboxylase [Micrococcales bacterium]|nr:diaminopimelate decarboxylase [Micrococcales bacterium]